jgi:uncharacterized protein YbaR (Trm112 family)
MFVELIEYLRCPRAHAESALVVSASRTDARHIVDGVLGCPVCNAEFRIEHGVAWFTNRLPDATLEPPSDDVAMRLAAFLQLTDNRGPAVLCGRHASHAGGIGAMSDTPLILVNAPRALALDVAASLVVDDAMPFATGILRGAAIDESAGTPLVQSIVRVVRAGGHVVGPVTLTVPEGVSEIVRDDRLWVAEKSAAPDSPAPRLVAIGRAPR